jgi:hypothetical protein
MCPARAGGDLKYCMAKDDSLFQILQLPIRSHVEVILGLYQDGHSIAYKVQSICPPRGV